jgi:hypothetical protein
VPDLALVINCHYVTVLIFGKLGHRVQRQFALRPHIILPRNRMNVAFLCQMLADIQKKRKQFAGTSTKPATPSITLPSAVELKKNPLGILNPSLSCPLL